jgi:acetyl esterase/lipase
MKLLLLPLAALAIFIPATISAVQVIENLPYGDAGPENLLDLYLPESGKSHPLVVLIHGGGWTGGSRAGKRDVSVARALAAEGFAVASMDYRLAPKYQWPVQLEDIRAALAFLASRAGEYQLAMDRLALFGGSAGGHLALMAAYRQDETPALPRIRAVVAFYPITNLLTRQETDETGVSLNRVKEATAVKLLGSPLASARERWAQASPASHVNPGVPPTFLAHGRKDKTVNHEQSTELAALLQVANVPHEVVIFPDAGHTFDLSTWNGKPLSANLTPAVAGFLRSHLTE